MYPYRYDEPTNIGNILRVLRWTEVIIAVREDWFVIGSLDTEIEQSSTHGRLSHQLTTIGRRLLFYPVTYSSSKPCQSSEHVIDRRYCPCYLPSDHG